MSVKYSWWGFARNMIADYPQLKAQYEDILAPTLAPNNDGMPHGTAISNPTEQAIQNAEEREAYRQYWAVKKALDPMIKRHGWEFCEFIKLYYWTRPRIRIEQIAERLNVPSRTIFEWNKIVIKMVGRNRGWI